RTPPLGLTGPEPVIPAFRGAPSSACPCTDWLRHSRAYQHRGRASGQVGEELLQASLGCFVPLDLAWPSSRGGVVDELLLDLKACAQTGGVGAGSEELRAGQHEVALARPLGRGAQAVAEFELGLEKVCVQPRHRFGIEPVLTKGVRGRACE